MSTRRELANAIRALTMDAVQKANSGHPGAALAMVFPELGAELLRRMAGDLPPGLDALVHDHVGRVQAEAKSLASRQLNQSQTNVQRGS